MRKTILTFTVLLALLLAGCTDNDDLESSAKSTVETNSETTDIFGNSEALTETPNENLTKLTGLSGDRISESEITLVFGADGSDEYTDDTFQSVVCDGFVYLAESSSVSMNSIDNADGFDSELKTFAEMSDERFKDYKRFNVGDTISGLTVSAAQCGFTSDSVDGYDKNTLSERFPEIYFNSGSCELSGELEMTGYACVIPEDEYGIESGTILFIPSGECRLPVMGYEGDSENGIFHRVSVGMNRDFVWAGEYGQIKIGNVNSTAADVSALPEDGTFVKVTVIVNSIRLSSAVNFTNIATAEVVEITAE